MTRVTYRNDSECFEIEFSGHADFAPRGKDIVCAGISVLASELLLASRRARQKGEITDLQSSAGEGLVRLHFRYAATPCAMREVVEVVLECLQNIALEYGENLMLEKSN